MGKIIHTMKTKLKVKQVNQLNQLNHYFRCKTRIFFIKTTYSHEPVVSDEK